MTYNKSNFSNIHRIVFEIVFVILFTACIPILSSNDLVSVYILHIVNSSTIVLLFWIMIDTKYKISKGNLYCKSGPFHRTIPVSEINKIDHHKGLIVPVTFKPSLSHKGLILHYHKFDNTYISTKKQSAFLKILLETNPKIQIIKPTNEL